MSNKLSQFEQQLAQQLNDSVKTIDSSLQSKLSQARYKAIESTRKKASLKWAWLTGIVSTATALFFLITIMPDQPSYDSGLIAENHTDLLIMTEIEDIDLYSDLEFYQWLNSIDTQG